ncbi:MULTISPECIES: hypothetical protein [unclassified Methylobacterium]|uniref:hypothetical protein n=1 Tax=unclassified Methylobacterium TaxID=2615210 RepID=UPI000CC106DC|nr:MULTISPECIES: hypothetical protein [unclassified Methylobacterium]PIU06616.1 MAG: hypothetical protein COT56_08780 [Methylobacterium sp. CG09_land_8_20_14_0_10_71_15]PIU12108.1 MAG: hypothetical protein COT28_16900 [Methylobacterium sp. CG08_land_8_20_14_0_20_71_15]
MPRLQVEMNEMTRVLDAEEFEGEFDRILKAIGVTPMRATTVEANIRQVFALGSPSMSAHELTLAWMTLKRAQYGKGYASLDVRKVMGTVGLLSEAIAAGLVRADGRGAQARFELTQAAPVYERASCGARFVLPPGPRSTRHERHTAFVGTLLAERLARIAHHPASRSNTVPDALVWASPFPRATSMADALPSMLRYHENPRWNEDLQVQWLALVTGLLWRLDYSLPEAAIPEDDVEALGALV